MDGNAYKVTEEMHANGFVPQPKSYAVLANFSRGYMPEDVMYTVEVDAVVVTYFNWHYMSKATGAGGVMAKREEGEPPQ